MSTASVKPVVLVTGANTGLGLAIVKSLCQSSVAYDILLGSRSVQKGEDAAATLSAEVHSTVSSLAVVKLDLESDVSVRDAVDYCASKFGRLDVVVHNAGACFDSRAHQGQLSTRELWNLSWDVNVTGAQVLTELAVPLLLKSKDPRLIFMTSGTASLGQSESTVGRINQPPPAGWPKNSAADVPAYRSVKTGLNMMMREWARTLGNDGVKVWSISPGLLATGLNDIGAEKMKQMGAKDPSEGGDFTRDVIEGKRDDDVGKIVGAGRIQPW